VPLNDVIRSITCACTLVIIELDVASLRFCDLSVRPDGELEFSWPADGVFCNRRQETPITVFFFAIRIRKFHNITLI